MACEFSNQYLKTLNFRTQRRRKERKKAETPKRRMRWRRRRRLTERETTHERKRTRNQEVFLSSRNMSSPINAKEEDQNEEALIYKGQRRRFNFQGWSYEASPRSTLTPLRSDWAAIEKMHSPKAIKCLKQTKGYILIRTRRQQPSSR